MKIKESYYAELYRIEDPLWNPAPRESATLTTINFRSYLIGGQNYEACREIASVKVNGEYT
jgi:hypothetical protein